MAYINGQKIAFSSYLVDGNGYYNKEETAEMLDLKADKVSEPTEDNLTSLDANGNLKDSGVASGTVATKTNVNALSVLPSGTYTDIDFSGATSGAIEKNISAPANGYCFINGQMSSTAGYVGIRNLSCRDLQIGYDTTAYGSVVMFLPVKKGDSIRLKTTQKLANLWVCRFIHSSQV